MWNVDGGMTMKRTLLMAAIAVATWFVLSASAIYADSITFTANLTGSLEVPATGSSGTGSATVTIDTVLNTMQVNVAFSGLSSGTTASHIHCCLASPFLTGANVGVATAVPTFTGFPLGVTSGTYSHLFDLTLASSYNPAFVSSSIFNPSGTVSGAEAALVAGIEAGDTYLNIHTTNFPSGEIRGFLVPTPEPSSILLLGSGLVALICTRRRLARKN
jgi:hypothetical protein